MYDMKKKYTVLILISFAMGVIFSLMLMLPLAEKKLQKSISDDRNNTITEMNELSDILRLYNLFLKNEVGSNNKKGEHNKSNDKIKLMMIYIHEHYREKISIPELAAAAYLSERECYRVFHDCLHVTPVEYITTYRLQVACQMLAKGQESVTVISHECGLGSSSYFGKVFREYTHCSPTEYRRKWQNSDR